MPLPLLFGLDIPAKKYYAVFTYERKLKYWQVGFESSRGSAGKKTPHQFYRRLYSRGSSFEVTIPMPMLFDLTLTMKKYDVLFTRESRESPCWAIHFAERGKRIG